jgi:uncharacterized membrane protein
MLLTSNSVTTMLALFRIMRFPTDKVLTTILIAAILGGIASLGYTIASPASGRGFTEFYIVGPDGEAGNYPANLVIGQEGEVRIGIISRERETTSYQITTEIDGARQAETSPLILTPDEKWEGVMGFTPEKVGDNQKVAFSLYKNETIEPYLELFLWIDVGEY